MIDSRGILEVKNTEEIKEYNQEMCKCLDIDNVYSQDCVV